MTDRRGDDDGRVPPPPEASSPGEGPPAPVQVTPPQGWPPAEATAPVAPLGQRPLPDLRRLDDRPAPLRPSPARIPIQSSRPRSLLARLLMWLLKLALAFVILSLLWVALYRFVAPPITLTMVGDLFGGHRITKRWVPLEGIDPVMARAVIAAEDSRFCTHNGLDFQAIEKAFERNQRGGRVRGGSTISQQTAKNVFLWQGGGYFRKGLEAWFALLIENIWGKRRIMEVYLNVAETGIGTYGVEAGAMRYFNHGASRLTAQEAARIAAVLPLPKKRAATDPRGSTNRYGRRIAARIPIVASEGLDSCVGS